MQQKLDLDPDRIYDDPIHPILERGPLFRILGPPKQQVSNIFKKIQRGDSRLVILHEILSFLMQILPKKFQFFWSSICLETEDLLSNLCTGLGFSTCTFLWN